MTSLHPLTKDALVLAVGGGAATRFTIRRGALEMLLDNVPGVATRRIAVTLGRDAEVGTVTLSRTGRTLEIRLHDPPRLFLAGAEDARRFLKGELQALALVDATDNAAEPAPKPAEDAEAKRRAQQERLRALVAARLPPKPEERE